MATDSRLGILLAVFTLVLLAIGAHAEAVNGNGARLYLETSEYWSGTSQQNSNGATLISVGSTDDGGVQANASGARLTINPLSVLPAGKESNRAEARFTANPVWGKAPLRVQFRNESSGGAKSILTYAWDFGDGEVSDEASPVHEYRNVGEYSVTLMIATSTETASITKSSLVMVAEEVPGAGVYALVFLVAVLVLLLARFSRRNGLRLE